MGKCIDNKILAIIYNLGLMASKAIARILCNQLKSALTAVRVLLSSQLLVLEATLTLATIYAENFVVAPANLLADAMGGVDDGIVKPLMDLGIDNKCGETRQILSSVDDARRPLKTAKRKLEGFAEDAHAYLDDKRDKIAKIHAAIDSIDKLLDIPCP